MPTETPNVGAPEWASEQASPWVPHNKALRIFDAFAAYTIIEDRDLTSPPGACADGARYLLPAAGVLGTDWLGHNGKLAIAVGANASNGWLFATVAVEGVFLWVRDENIGIRHNGAAWAGIADGISNLSALLDVDVSGIADGYVLKWDASNGLWYAAPDLSGIAPVREVSGGSYNLANSDLGYYLRFTNTGVVTVTVRAQATHVLTPGGEWHMRNAGLADLTIAPVAGVEINAPVGGTLVVEPGGTVTLKSIAADKFDLLGATLPLTSG